MNNAPFYRYSFENAKHNNQEAQWRESLQANIDCRRYIDSSKTGLSATAYDGFHVDKGYAKKVVNEFGLERTMHVISNTVRYNLHDGRWSDEVKEWAKGKYEGTSKEHTNEYILNTHTGLVDILAKNVKEIYNKLNLYNNTHCDDIELADFECKIVILSPRALKEKYWSPENQLWYATGGFGCSPTASGRAVYATALCDGEKTRWDRSQFIGVMKDEFIPKWAIEKLEQMNSPKQQPEMGM